MLSVSISTTVSACSKVACCTKHHVINIINLCDNMLDSKYTKGRSRLLAISSSLMAAALALLIPENNTGEKLLHFFA